VSQQCEFRLDSGCRKVNLFSRTFQPKKQGS
jgi:hypothetical protein